MMVTHNPLALPPSLYADTAVPPVATPPLDSDRTVSVAIIGGGFAGLSTALHLAEQGTDVIVLEAREPGWGASGNNGGQLNAGLKLDPDTIEATFGADLGRRMIAFAYNTPTFALDLIRRHHIACEARQNGTLRAAYHEANAAAVEKTAEQCIRRGMPVTVLDRDALREATGTDRYVRAMLDRRGGDLQPLSYARGLAGAAIAAGAAGYVPSAKIAFEARRRFWEEDEQIYGGISWTTQDITQIWYPSTDFHGRTGIILGAFGLGYAITTLVGGFAVDRYGARVVLAIAAILWSLSIGTTAFASGFAWQNSALPCAFSASGSAFLWYTP